MLYVTGITGHSGKWFLNRLVTEKYAGKIRFVMRNTKEIAPEKYAVFENCKLNIEFAVGDLADENFMKKSLDGIDTIIHISGINFSPKLIDAAIENKVKRAIVVHTTGRFSQYKSASDEYIKIEDGILSLRDQGKIDITILRPTMIYGSSGDRNMYRLVGYLHKHKFFPMFGDGSNLMQPVHASDLGYAYYDVLMQPETTRNKDYNLSGKEPIPYIQIIEMISKYLKRNNIIVRIPMGLSIFAAKIYNVVFGKRAIISVEQVMRMKEDKAFDHQAARLDFGYEPIPFAAGIKGEVNEYMQGVRVDFSNVTYQ